MAATAADTGARPDDKGPLGALRPFEASCAFMQIADCGKFENV
jgi:hypothetical protein